MTPPASAARLATGLGLLLGLVLTACAGRGGAPAPSSDEPDVVLLVDEEGPWRALPVPAAEGAADTARAVPAEPPARVVVPPPGLHPRRGPPLAVPTRRVTPAPAALGAPPPKSPRDLARERYLDHPTRIRARRITFYCPSPFLPETRLTGDDVRETRPGRRVASGHARLTCRELTLEADTITLRTRDAEDADLQITARGDVSLVTDQRGQVMREEGVRTVILTNEKIVPLH